MVLLLLFTPKLMESLQILIIALGDFKVLQRLAKYLAYAWISAFA